MVLSSLISCILCSDRYGVRRNLVLRESEPVLKAYVAGLIRAACRLWRFVMPAEAKAVFQNDVFHPVTVNPHLQAHLGLTFEKRISTCWHYIVRGVSSKICSDMQKQHAKQYAE